MLKIEFLQFHSSLFNFPPIETKSSSPSVNTSPTRSPAPSSTNTHITAIESSSYPTSARPTIASFQPRTQRHTLKKIWLTRCAGQRCWIPRCLCWNSGHLTLIVVVRGRSSIWRETFTFRCGRAARHRRHD